MPLLTFAAGRPPGLPEQVGEFHILPQPDDSSCGPTALHAVYRHFGFDLSLERILKEVTSLQEGGTLAVLLGIHALQHGLNARIHSYNLRVLDPTWDQLPRQEVRRRIVEQLRHKRGKKLRIACEAYAKFLDLGGELDFQDLDRRLLKRYLDRDLPVLTGLSATYLYRSMREREDSQGRLVHDDLRGTPTGHFVVLHGMKGDLVQVADPFQDNPLGVAHHYEEPVDRVIRAILLGVMTYDANLLILSKEPL